MRSLIALAMMTIRNCRVAGNILLKVGHPFGRFNLPMLRYLCDCSCARTYLDSKGSMQFCLEPYAPLLLSGLTVPKRGPMWSCYVFPLGTYQSLVPNREASMRQESTLRDADFVHIWYRNFGTETMYRRASREGQFISLGA